MALAQPNTTAEQANGITLPPLLDNLALTQSMVAIKSPNHIMVNQTLTMTQQVNYNPKYLHVSSVISFVDVANRGDRISIALNDFFSMGDFARTVLTQSAGNTITFIQSPTVTRSFGSGIGLGQSVSIQINRILLPQSTLTLQQEVAIIKRGDPGFIPIVVVEPVSPIAQKVQLVYGAWTLTLDSPLFGDSDEIEHLRINRQTRAGERIIYHDPIWPVLERITYNFDNLNEQKKTDLLNFLNASLGQLITMIDYNGIHWSVMITNPDLEIAQRGPCSYEAQIEFEGARA